MLLAPRAGRYGRWRTDRCRVVSDDGVTTTCDCAQLGHFGLLFVSVNILDIHYQVMGQNATAHSNRVREVAVYISITREPNHMGWLLH